MPGRVLAQSRSNVDNGVTRQVADVGLIKAAHTSIRLAALVLISDRRPVVFRLLFFENLLASGHLQALVRPSVAEFQDSS